MDKATKALAEYINQKGFSLTTIAESVGMPYKTVWLSLSVKGNRDLRADEFLSICSFVGKNPFEFYRTKKAS